MKKPNVPIRTAAVRAGAELTIIVIGVLIALSAQAWWENRQLLDDRGRILAAMESDLSTARSALEASVEDADSATVVIRWILDPDTDLASVPDTVLLTRTRLALWEIYGGEVKIPSYDEVRSSGRVDLIPDTVRSVLRPVLVLRDELEARNEDLFQYQVGNLDPWLLDNLRLRDVLHWDDPDLASEDQVPPTPTTLRSLRVENMLLAKLQLVGYLQSTASSGLETVDQALAVVRHARGF